jgi:hypothetical protein
MQATYLSCSPFSSRHFPSQLSAPSHSTFVFLLTPQYYHAGSLRTGANPATPFNQFRILRFVGIKQRKTHVYSCVKLFSCYFYCVYPLMLTATLRMPYVPAVAFKHYVALLNHVIYAYRVHFSVQS